MMKDIILNSDVLARDGEKVGSVDKIIVNPGTLEVEGFVVHEGLVFGDDRIVDEEFVDRTDPDGNVVLKISSDQEEDLPALTTQRVIEPKRGMLDRLAEMEHLAMPSSTGQVLVMSEPVDEHFAPAPDSPMQPAPSGSPTVVDETNFPPNTVALEEGTEVVDVDGKKIGVVDELIYDSSDRLQSLVIEQGMFFKEHTRVPASWVESASSETVHLSCTRDEMKAAGESS